MNTWTWAPASFPLKCVLFALLSCITIVSQQHKKWIFYEVVRELDTSHIIYVFYWAANVYILFMTTRRYNMNHHHWTKYLWLYVFESIFWSECNWKRWRSWYDSRDRLMSGWKWENINNDLMSPLNIKSLHKRDKIKLIQKRW